MTAKVLEGDTPLDPQLLDFFLKGNLSLEKAARRKPFDWFPDAGWQDLMRLVELGQKKLGPDGKIHVLARCEAPRSRHPRAAPTHSFAYWNSRLGVCHSVRVV